MSATRVPTENHLLRTLAADSMVRLLPHVECIELPLGTVLYESGEALRHVYFPVDCIVSLLYVLLDGSSAEIAVVGNDGLVGIPLFMGGETTPNRALVQSAGHAYRLPGPRLKEEFHSNDTLQGLLLRYTQALIAYSGDCDRPFRPNVTGDSAGSALGGFLTPIGHVPSTPASLWSASSLLVSRRSRRGV